MTLEVENTTPILLEPTLVVILLGSGLTHRDSVLGLQMTRIVNHGQSHVLVLTGITTPGEFLGVTHSDMRGNVIHSVHYLLRNVVVALNLIQQIPHRVVVNYNQRS